MLTRLKDFWSYKINPYELCIVLKRNAHKSNLFKNLDILKLPENCILIWKYFNQSLPKVLKIGLLLQQLRIHIIPDSLPQVALKYFLIKRKYMEDIQSI